MGAAGASTAARYIKRSWWGAEWRCGGTNGSRGQRPGVPSSVIICMLVPLSFFSWLSETKGSSLPGLASGDGPVQGRRRHGVVIETVSKDCHKGITPSQTTRGPPGIYSETFMVVRYLKVEYPGLKCTLECRVDTKPELSRCCTSTTTINNFTVRQWKG